MNEIIGQNRVTALLTRMIMSEKLPHALLLVGPRGAGKDAVALTLARWLLCDGPKVPLNSCGSCQACKAVRVLQHPDLLFVSSLPVGKNEDGRSDHPLGKLSGGEVEHIQAEYAAKGSDPYHLISIPKARQIKVSSIREVKRTISRTASDNTKRVVVVSNAEEMRTESANAFLKTLEEPHHDVQIVLTSSHPDRLLPTIQSRCQQIRFDPLDESDIERALIERDGTAPAEAALAAKLSGGSFTTARQMLTDEFSRERYEVLAFLRSTLKRSPLAAHEEIESISSGSDVRRIERILTLLLVFLRDLFIARTTGSETGVVNSDQIADIRSFLQNFPDAELEDMISATEESISAIRRNAHSSLVLSVLAMRMIDACYQRSVA